MPFDKAWNVDSHTLHAFYFYLLLTGIFGGFILGLRLLFPHLVIGSDTANFIRIKGDFYVYFNYLAWSWYFFTDYW